MPITTNLDRVRLLVGDTSSSDPILTDDEVDYFIASRSLVESGSTVDVNVPAAAADAAGAIAAEYARSFNFAEDGQRFDRAQRFAHYSALANDLRRRAGGTAGTITAGTL